MTYKGKLEAYKRWLEKQLRKVNNKLVSLHAKPPYKTNEVK